MAYLASVDMVDETTTGQYTANDVTKNLAQNVARAGISHWQV